jgi:hypothetical protein
MSFHPFCVELFLCFKLISKLILLPSFSIGVGNGNLLALGLMGNKGAGEPHINEAVIF